MSDKTNQGLICGETSEGLKQLSIVVPERIEPILAVGRFGWAVQQAAGVNINLEDWERKTYEATEKEFAEWRAQQKLPKAVEVEKVQRDAWEKINAAWKESGVLEEDLKKEQEKIRDLVTDEEQKEQHLKAAYAEWQKRRESISKPLLAPLNKIHKTAEYKAEKACCDKKRNEIEAACRKRLEKEKAAREKELKAEAVEELREALAQHGATRRGDRWLVELFEFIRRDGCSGKIISPAIGAADLARIVKKVEELTGKDITKSVLIEREPRRHCPRQPFQGLENEREVEK